MSGDTTDPMRPREAFEASEPADPHSGVTRTRKSFLLQGVEVLRLKAASILSHHRIEFRSPPQNGILIGDDESPSADSVQNPPSAVVPQGWAHLLFQNSTEFSYDIGMPG